MIISLVELIRASARVPGLASIALTAQFLLLTLADLRDPFGGLFFSCCAVFVSVVLRQPIFFLMILSIFFTTNLGQTLTSSFDIRLWYLLLAAHLSGQFLSVDGRREIRGLLRPQVLTCVLLLSLSVIVSFILAPEFDFDLARSGITTLSLSILGLVSGWLWLRRASESERRIGLFVFVLVPLLATTTWVVDKSVGLGLNPDNGLSFPLGKENQTAVALLVGLIILLLATHVGLATFAALATLVAFGINASGSRAVLLMVLLLIPAFLVVAISNRDKQTAQKAALLTLASLAGTLGAWFFSESQQDPVTGARRGSTSFDKEWLGDGDGSLGLTNVRFEAWGEGWVALLDRPVTGVGFRHSNLYVESLSHMHNSWLSLLVETGVVGLTCAAGVLFIFLRALATSSGPRHQKSLAAAALPVAIILAGYNFWDFQILWAIAGVGLAEATRNRSRTP